MHSLSAFLKAREIATTDSELVSPGRNWKVRSLGMCGIAASVAFVAFLFGTANLAVPRLALNIPDRIWPASALRRLFHCRTGLTEIFVNVSSAPAFP